MLNQECLAEPELRPGRHPYPDDDRGGAIPDTDSATPDDCNPS